MRVASERSHVRVIGREILEPREQGEDVFAFAQFETRKVVPAVLGDERRQDDGPGASKERADRSFEEGEKIRVCRSRQGIDRGYDDSLRDGRVERGTAVGRLE